MTRLHQNQLLALFCFTIFFFLSGVQGRHSKHLFKFKPNKLFVFGDSYADTGNNPITNSSSWKPPYGITFPGKPSGRYSDGRVLTDYVAQFIGVKSPIPYQWRKVGYKQVKNGMNFAYGGTGVFETLSSGPNITTQIGYFQELIHDNVYSHKDLKSSVALVTVSGNDYSAYLAKNGTTQGFPSFIASVINQLAINLEKIQKMGIRRIAVNALQPLGCLPRNTIATSHTNCSEGQNVLVNLHNVLLQQVVSKLNNNHTKNHKLIILDLYTAFTTVLTNKGSLKFEDPLEPCCEGVTSADNCGSVDDNGVHKYTVCSKPDSAFFWDSSHPTQAGWHAVCTTLQDKLKQIL